VTSKLLSTGPGILTVCVVGVAAAYLVTHPPQPMQITTPPAAVMGSSPSTEPDSAQPDTSAVPAPDAPATATPLAAPAPPNAAVPSPAPSVPAPAPSPAAPARPLRAPLAVPVGRPEFHVQAGAFKSREYADDLVRQLRASGYTSTEVDGPLIRVLVGPAMSRGAAERLAANLRANGFDTTLSPVR
jgi:cell division septation protein DedD